MVHFVSSIVAATSILTAAAGATSFDELRLTLDRAPQGFYVAKLEVTGQRKRLLVDTGSGDFWIRSRGSMAAGKGHQHTFLDKYGSGSVSGSVFSGRVHFKQDVEAICQFGAGQGGLLQNFPAIDGIWGLAPKGSIEGLARCLERQDRIQGRSISISLDDRGGTLVLGASATGLTKLPVVGSGTWSVALLRISVQHRSDSSQSLESQVLSGADTALLDTGSSSIHGPAASIERLAQAFAAERQDDGKLQVRCEPHSSLPDVTIQLPTQDGGEISVLLPARHFLQKADSRGWCSLKLAHSKSGQWILGDVFFQAMNEVVFDYENVIVGISVKSDALGVNQPEPGKLVPQHHNHYHHSTVSQHATAESQDAIANVEPSSTRQVSSNTQDAEQNAIDNSILTRQEEAIKMGEEEMEDLKMEDAEMMNGATEPPSKNSVLPPTPALHTATGAPSMPHNIASTTLSPTMLPVAIRNHSAKHGPVIN